MNDLAASAPVPANITDRRSVRLDRTWLNRAPRAYRQRVWEKRKASIRNEGESAAVTGVGMRSSEEIKRRIMPQAWVCWLQPVAGIFGCKPPQSNPALVLKHLNQMPPPLFWLHCFKLPSSASSFPILLERT